MPPNTPAPSVDRITIRKPDDWHLHVRDGAMLKASLPFTAPPGGTIGFIDFTGLNEFGSSLTLQFFQNTVPGNGWVFVSEVSFNGVPNNAVPEPASWAMLIAGFGLTGAAMRRRRRVTAAVA